MAKHQRQTAKYLQKRFAEIGLSPNSRHGQNFLIDYNLVELLARSGRIEPGDVVLEVGTGTGALTALIAQAAGHVVTVELDHHLYQMAQEELEEFSNITMLLQDALKNKNRIDSRVFEAIEQAKSEIGAQRFRLVANLPYNIATPLLSNLVRREPVPQSMTVTIQKELADRMMAKPSTKDYSSLSIWMQSLCQISLVRVLPPTVFWPRPKVDSAIIHIEPQAAWRERFVDLEFFHTFVRSLFFHRRKFLRSVLISAFKGRLGKPDIDEVIGEMGLGETARAEELPVEEIQRLCEKFRLKVNQVEQA